MKSVRYLLMICSDVCAIGQVLVVSRPYPTPTPPHEFLVRTARHFSIVKQHTVVPAATYKPKVKIKNMSSEPHTTVKYLWINPETP